MSCGLYIWKIYFLDGFKRGEVILIINDFTTQMSSQYLP